MSYRARAYSLLAVTAVLLASCSSSTQDPEQSVEPDATDQTQEPVNEPSDPAPEPVADGNAASTVPGSPATVQRVIDGDSLELAIDGQVEESRMIGINTPEGDECLGAEAKARLAELTEGVPLFVESSGRDEFGRLLVLVRTEGNYINLQLVREGLAVARDQSGHDDAERFDEAEAQAREEGLGIWATGACGEEGAPVATVRIVTVNADAPGQDNWNPNGEWIELINDGDTAQDMSAWIVRDESTRHRYEFPSGYTLAPGATVKLFSGVGTETQNERYWGKFDDSVWNNGGDTAFVNDASGSTVDTYSY